WHGIPTHLQGILELRLQSKNPTFDNSNPWPIQSVYEVAESHFKRSKYTSHLSHLPMLGIEEDSNEEEDSDDDYNYDSDSEEEYERECRKRRKLKALKKKKKTRTKTRQTSPTQVMIEEPSRNIKVPPEERGVEGLIERLNTMSIDDPHYGALYYQAVSQDKLGLVAQCIMRKPKQATRELQPHQYTPALERQPYPKGILPRQPTTQMSSKCYGCFDVGHSLRDCPKMSQLLNQGIISLDPNTFKYRLSDGQPI